MRRSAEKREPSQALGATTHVYTIGAGQPFLAVLARAILDGDLPASGGNPPEPLALSDITVLLPTQRAASALENAFLEAVPNRALLLPRIRPLAEGEEEFGLISAFASPSLAPPEDLDIPPAMSEVERRLTLTRLVMAWSDARRRAEASDTSLAAIRRDIAADRPAKAARLAADLSRLIDRVEREGASLDGLEELVSGEFSEHWREVIAFLDIVTRAWPAHLAERGLISAAERRNRLMRAEARRLTGSPGVRSVIVAGVAHATPATAELMRAVLGSPRGAVVFAGLDGSLDDESWATIVPDHPEHPQFGLAKLLERLGLDRSDVRALPGGAAPAEEVARAVFLNEALRPATTTEKWQEFASSARRDDIAAALDGVSLVEAPTAQDEAETVALILREAVQAPARTAALVTPDRKLARRVAARLEAWGIRAGSADQPLAKTLEGSFLDLIAGAADKGFASPDLVALLNHPLCRLGFETPALRRAAQALELAAFRAPYLGRGLDGVAEALNRAAHEVAARQRRHIAVTRLREDAWDGARELVRRLQAAFEPLVAAYARPCRQPLGQLASAHAEVAQAVARLPAGEDEGLDPAPPWNGAAGEALKALLAAMSGETEPQLELLAADYADFYRVVLGGETVRPQARSHPRISIWMPAEARLRQADIMVLGSLNDGTWPEVADPGPWLNRPMCKALGLSAPEERIGHAAHDFMTGLGAPRVVLTRAEKVDGAPTVPSRWLMRIKALLDALGQGDGLGSHEPWLAWARTRDHVRDRVRLRPPEPRPPVALRPRRMSVSSVETWIANPYSVYARDILGLEALDGLGLPPGPRVHGTVIHGALSRFARKFPRELPQDPERELLALARGVLRDYADDPRVAAFWLPRFERFARWFAETEPARRDGNQGIAAEVAGELVIEAPGGAFVLNARADRIDVGGGSLAITDYKLGSNLKDIAGRAARGEAPQLLLEAAIAACTGFAHVERQPVQTLRYISTSGGEPPGDEQIVKCADVAALATGALDGLKRLVESYDRQTTPYRAMRRARFTYTFDGYAHLARVAEWAGHEDGEG